MHQLLTVLFHTQINILLLMVATFFFHDTATPEIYTLSLHDALPISPAATRELELLREIAIFSPLSPPVRSEEHTSELQSRENLVCRLLLEKKKNELSTFRTRQVDPVHLYE